MVLNLQSVNITDIELADMVDWTGFALKFSEMDQTTISIIKKDHPSLCEQRELFLIDGFRLIHKLREMMW